MASVFLSYDRDDAEKARPIAAALEKAGHSVWWDLHVRGGAQFAKVIEEALNAADAVVVLWSAHSVESAWVRDEAAAGRDSGRLIPVRIDAVEPPLGFRQFQTINLSAPKSRRAALAELKRAVAESARERPPAAEPPPTASKRAVPVSLFGALALVLLAAIAAAVSWQAKRSERGNSVAVVAGNADPRSKAAANNLLVDLGTLQLPQSGELKLLDETSNQQPELIFKVAAGAGANLSLVDGHDRTLLWSTTFEPASSTVDLQQQVAYTAARLLECATEARRSDQALRPEIVRLYLGSCAKFAEIYPSSDIQLIVPTLREVVNKSPKFEAAWRKLLLAQAAAVGSPENGGAPAEQSLWRNIEAARKRSLALPEADIAQSVLLPSNQFIERMRLIEHAAATAADDPSILAVRSAALMRVGRSNEALGDAEKAARLNPLSPSMRNPYILALAYSGRVPRAFEELRKAEELSPGTSNLLEARFWLDLRYGDPNEALAILRKFGTSQAHEAFLVARIDPDPAKVDRAVALARASAADNHSFETLVHVLAAFGRNDEIFATLMRWDPGTMLGDSTSSLFRPDLKPFREKAGFLRVAEHLGLLRYWQESGQWPDFCSEPDLPYDCKKEAAKLT